jgi:hypothetical protein
MYKLVFGVSWAWEVLVALCYVQIQLILRCKLHSVKLLQWYCHCSWQSERWQLTIVVAHNIMDVPQHNCQMAPLYYVTQFLLLKPSADWLQVTLHSDCYTLLDCIACFFGEHVKSAQNYWVFGLFPSSGILENTTFRKLDLFPSFSPTFTWGWKQIQFPKRRVF